MTGFYVDNYELIYRSHDGLRTAISTFRSCGGIARLREVYRMAMEKASRNSEDLRLRYELLRLHDRKGHLTVVWRSAAGFHNLASYVEQAWVFLREESIEHVTLHGTALAHGLCSDGIREYARGVSAGCDCKFPGGVNCDCEYAIGGACGEDGDQAAVQ